MEFIHAGAHRSISVQKPENQTLHKTFCYHRRSDRLNITLTWNDRKPVQREQSFSTLLMGIYNQHQLKKWVICSSLSFSRSFFLTKIHEMVPPENQSALINSGMEIRKKWELHNSLFSWICHTWALFQKHWAAWGGILRHHTVGTFPTRRHKAGCIIALPSKTHSFVQILSWHRMYL